MESFCRALKATSALSTALRVSLDICKFKLLLTDAKKQKTYQKSNKLAFFNLVLTSLALPFCLLKRPLATLNTGLFRDCPCLCLSFLPIFSARKRKRQLIGETEGLNTNFHGCKYSFFYVYFTIFLSFRCSIGIWHSFNGITMLSYVHDRYTRDFSDPSFQVFITSCNNIAFVLSHSIH